MNKAQQIHRAEYFLHGVQGNTIIAAKKKRKIFATTSKEISNKNQEYQLPATYKSFLDELTNACKSGDEDSKKKN